MSGTNPVRTKAIVLALVVLCGLGFLWVQWMLPAKSDPVPWHFEFSEVRAFRINWDEEYPRDGILSGDRLNESRLPKEGILLSDEQVDQLRRALLEGDPRGPMGMCHYPHHSFVFYSSEGEIVGHTDICFLCRSAGGIPPASEAVPDYRILREIFGSLGMPIENPEWEE